MSLLSFCVFTHVCHGKVYCLEESGRQKDRALVDVQIKKWKYRKESYDYFIVYLLNRQRRKHTHTTPTHTFERILSLYIRARRILLASGAHLGAIASFIFRA